MRYAVVFNPAAQNGRAGRHRAALEAALRVENVPFSLLETEGPGHATVLAREAAAEADVVVAVGGDGTVQEVVQGIYASGAVLGVLPFGTGNDLAYALGMPEDLWESVQALLAAPPRTIDLGHARWREHGDGGLGERETLFANCLGVGFDALVARNARRFKALGGRAAYHAAVFRTLWSWTQPEIEVTVSLEEPAGVEVVALNGASGDASAGPSPLPAAPPPPERIHDGRFLLIEIGNGFSVGGGFFLTPDARVDDGLLDVCLIDRASRRRIVKLLPTAFTGQHVHAPEVTMRQARRITIRSAAPLPVQADGEALTERAQSLEVTVRPGALRVLAPKLRRD